jgi:hypothetical protein
VLEGLKLVFIWGKYFVSSYPDPGRCLFSTSTCITPLSPQMSIYVQELLRLRKRAMELNMEVLRREIAAAEEAKKRARAKAQQPLMAAREASSDTSAQSPQLAAANGGGVGEQGSQTAALAAAPATVPAPALIAAQPREAADKAVQVVEEGSSAQAVTALQVAGTRKE